MRAVTAFNQTPATQASKDLVPVVHCSARVAQRQWLLTIVADCYQPERLAELKANQLSGAVNLLSNLSAEGPQKAKTGQPSRFEARNRPKMCEWLSPWKAGLC